MADGFIDAGFADNGLYQAPDNSAPVACRVFIDRQRRAFGDFGSVAGNAITIRLLLSEIPTPTRGSTVTADGQTFKLVGMVTEDAAMSIWDVAP